MIELKNLRLEKDKEWTKLVVDITSNKCKLPDDTIWFALPNEHAYMFTDETYDPFLLITYFYGMFWGEDIWVHGKVSKLFYRNLTMHLSQIFDEFSDHTQRISLTVDGFVKVQSVGNIIGVSGSCGFDSLCTIFDNYVMENDPDYKINAMFLFNCGNHNGEEYGEGPRRRWLNHLSLNYRAAKELNLPLFQMDSNLHAFILSMYRHTETIVYLATYSCVIACQKYVRKYYMPSDVTIAQTWKLHEAWRDGDIAVSNGHLLTSMIRTECLEIVLYGTQYNRHEKLLHIADWEIAQKYVHVCIRPLPDGRNCSVNCVKCRSALLVLDAAGKADKFSGAFDIPLYRSRLRKVKIQTVNRYYQDPFFSRDAVDFLNSKGVKMPPFPIAVLLNLPRKLKHYRKVLREGNGIYAKRK